jgi:chromosome segregation ATPase
MTELAILFLSIISGLAVWLLNLGRNQAKNAGILLDQAKQEYDRQSDARADFINTKKELNELKENIQDLRQKSDAFKIENENLNKLIHDQEGLIKRLQTELAKVEVDLAKLSQENKTLAIELKNKENALNAALHQKALLEAELSGVKSVLNTVPNILQIIKDNNHHDPVPVPSPTN